MRKNRKYKSNNIKMSKKYMYITNYWKYMLKESQKLKENLLLLNS